MIRRLTLIALAATVCALLVPSAALADGDPASDTLLGENVFYPYAPPVTGTVARTLNAETAAAKRDRFPIKVALIAAPTDLGVIPSLFGKPQQYADFLDQEISFAGKQQLLVVMADGYGTAGLTGPARLAASALRPPAGRTSTDLAQAAITAVARISAAGGHPINGVKGLPGSSSGSTNSSSTTPLLIGLIVAALLVAAAVVLRRRRQPVRR